LFNVANIRKFLMDYRPVFKRKRVLPGWNQFIFKEKIVLGEQRWPGQGGAGTGFSEHAFRFRPNGLRDPGNEPRAMEIAVGRVFWERMTFEGLSFDRHGCPKNRLTLDRHPRDVDAAASCPAVTPRYYLKGLL
jgi:hypothetical protein